VRLRLRLKRIWGGGTGVKGKGKGRRGGVSKSEVDVRCLTIATFLSFLKQQQK
jgi:hypothetical protein